MSLTIDCETCPVRGRHCGDCIVPVLGRVWLAEAPGRPVETTTPAPAAAEHTAPTAESNRGRANLPLDFEETEAVEAFARAGLISRVEASGVRAQLTGAAAAAG